MASLAQMEANRGNALLSTGPRTVIGKARSSGNALKHGLLSKAALMKGESAEEFNSLREGLLSQLRPDGELEHLFFEQIVAATWRFRRILRLEAAILDLTYFSNLLELEKTKVDWGSDDAPKLPSLYVLGERGRELEERNQSTLERMRRCLVELQNENLCLAKSYASKADAAEALSRLTRYAASIERGLYRATHELERLQAARRGERVPAPVTVDVGVYGESGG